MNKKLQKLLIIIIFFSFTTFESNAQDKNSDLEDITIHLLSGDTLNYKLLEIKEDHLAGYQKKNKKDIWKFKIYPKSDVLFYSTPNLNKNWVYFPDSSVGNVLSKEHMEQYVLGKKKAKNTYQPIKHFVLGIISGMSIGVLDSYQSGVFNKANSGLVIAVPVISTLIIRTKNLKEKELKEQASLENEYKKGFHSVKKTKNYIGASSGSVLGAVIAVITNNILGN